MASLIDSASTASFVYDAYGKTQATGSAALQDLTLGYDNSGNINSIADAVTANLSQTFQYDLVGGVAQGVGAYGTENYTYDALGNRLTRSLVNGGTTNTTYTYTSTNTRLASAATGSQTLSYTYDANGARTAVKLGNQTQASYTYNADARLATSGTNSFKYNGFGERSVATVTGGGAHFIFGDSMLLAEHGSAGALVRNYIYLNGQPLALVDGAGTVSYILNDQIGQPQKMLNTAGAVSWHRVAGIFGTTVSQPVGTTATNPQRFPRQQFDANLGLHYNYFRTYDPATGRYLETDPIGLEGGMNLYTYVDGNPVNYIDPDGKIPLLLIPLLGAIGGGVTDAAIQGARLWYRGCDVFEASNYDKSSIAISAGAGAVIPGPLSAAARIAKRYKLLKGAPRGLNREIYRAADKATKGDIGKQVARGAGIGAAKAGADAATGSGDDCGCK